MATQAYFTQPQTQGMRSFSDPVNVTSLKTMKSKVETHIPVVGHIITDEDIGILQGGVLQPINLNKVVKLLTDPHSAMLFDRHLNAIQKILKHYRKGFLMKDLVAVFKILNVCADRLEMQPIYVEPMCELLKLCARPFFKEKTSDATSFEQIAVESIAQMGYLMRVSNTKVRLQLCETLRGLYCKTQPEEAVQRLQANNLEYNRRVVELSDIAETLVKSLSLMESDTAGKLAVLSILQSLSKHSASNCNQMLKAEAANRLGCHLMDVDSTGQLLFRSVDILWNLLENGDQNEVAMQLSNLTCISQIRDAFVQQLTQGYSHYDRQLRNDLIVLACLVAGSEIQAPFVETGFTKQLCLLATFQEVKSHHALVRHLKLMPNHEDFELKKLLMEVLVTLTKHDTASIPIMSENRLLLALFSYVKANEKVREPQDWTLAQFEELQLHALSALCSIAPLMIEDYMMCQGSTRLLLMLEWCTRPDDFGGQGNSFHGEGGRNTKRAQMRHCLRLIRSMASSGEELVIQDLMDQGAINQLTDIVNAMVKSKCMHSAVDIEMQCDVLYILSALCEGDLHRKELFGSGGVDVVVEYMRLDTKLLTSGLGHHKLMLAAVDCVWCAVVGCYLTEDYFLEREGLFLLLDMIENCPKNMHNLVVGCMLDLCENTRAIPHVNTWRGKEDISAAHMLCNLWRQEEEEMDVKRRETGAIADMLCPLMGELQHQNQDVALSLPSTDPSRAIVDVSENMRAKIYAMFCKIGFIELPGLTTEDHVTLTIIEHYLDFKLGEVWSEVVSELGQEGVRPITPDREALEAIQRTVEDRTTHVAGIQTELLEAQQQQDLIDEQEHYAEIRDNHRQKEKAIKDFHDYIARTSNYTILQSAKQRQVLSIDASRVATKPFKQEQYHQTDIENLQVTTFCGRNIKVDSTPAELTGGPLAKYDAKMGTLQQRMPRYS